MRPLNSPFIQEKQPLQILVAERQLINQKVVRLILERLGHQPDIVRDGVQILEAFQQRFYDVVFLEIDLPEMDGLTVARHLAEKPSSNRPWLIAMASNWTASSQQACLEAGVNDYLSKPLQLEEVAYALSNYQPPETRLTVSSGMSAVNLQALYQFCQPLVGSRTLDQVGFIADLVETYASSTVQLLQKMQSAFEGGDRPTLHRTAHTLKSASASIYAEQLAEFCQCLEIATQNGDERIPMLMTQVRKEYERVQSELTSELQRWQIMIHAWKSDE